MTRLAAKRTHKWGSRKPLFVIINLSILFSLACSSLSLGQGIEVKLLPREEEAAVVEAKALPADLAQPAALESEEAQNEAPVEAAAQDAAPLHVIDVLPRPGSSDVDPESAVVATFDQPVVPLTDDQSKLSPAFYIQPPADGRAEWLNTSTYIFYPDPPLTGGMDYTVTMNTELVSATGAVLASGEGEFSDWDFFTAAPKLDAVIPDPEEGAIDLDQEIRLVFNQRMDTDSVAENLILQDRLENDVILDYAWEEMDTVLVITPMQLLSRDAAYKLVLPGKTLSAGGTRLGESVVQEYTTVPVLDVAGTQPEEGELLEGYFGFNNLSIKFTSPLDPYQKLQELVMISPAVTNVNYTLTERRIYISGNFEYNQVYTVTVSGDLKDRWGQSAAGARQLAFRTAPAPAGLYIPMLQAGMDTMTFMPNETSFTVQATNVDTVKFYSAPLSLETFFNLENTFYNDWETSSIPDIEMWQAELNLVPDQNTVLELPLRADQQTLSTGVYYYDVEVPEAEKNYMEPHPFVVVVSPLNLTIKRSADEVFLWAVDLRTETPAAGKEITFYDEWLNPVTTAVTGEDGTCRIDLPEWLDTSFAVYAITGRPGDEEFGLASDMWEYETSGRYFGMRNWLREDTRQTYLYTDRPIYRPGDTVNFRVVMRDEEGGGYAPPPTGEVMVSMLGLRRTGTSGREEIGSVNLSLSSYGTASGAITLPEDAVPGNYSIFTDDLSKTSLFFQVANYRKPEIDLQVDIKSDAIQAGDDLTATVQADYYFGAPAGDVGIAWALYGRTDFFPLPYEYLTGTRSTSWFSGGGDEMFYFDPQLGQHILSGTGQTALDGSLVIDINSTEILGKIDAENLHTLTLEVTVSDEDEATVSGRDTTLLHPASFYIGVRSEAWVGRAGVEAGFRIQTTDWEARPSGEHVLLAEFQKITWEQDDAADWSPGGGGRKAVFTTISSADLLTDGQGRARLAFVPPEPGTYVLKLSGGGAVTHKLFWVGGSQGAQWPKLPNQELALTSDKDVYQPGDVARILIPNALGTKNLALVTVEREKVRYAEVIEIEGGSFQWEIPLTEADAPNVFVAVTLLGQQGDGAPDFRQGYLQLEVEPVAQTLTVELLTTPTQAEPGGEVSFDIQVRDSYGQPVQGEFSISVVDKAVLALADSEAPGIVEAFYAPQTLRVNNAMNLSISANRIPLISIDGRGGGGGGPVETTPTLREDFKDTALWQGSVETDSFGLATVKMTLPDNLTTWVADLRGITRDTLVGSAGSEVVVSKPLLIRPQTPRFFVAGDHAALRAVVHNNTTQEQVVDVSIQTIGVDLDDGSAGIQQIRLAAGGRQTVTWWGTIQETEEVALVFKAQSEQFEDAARPEQGVLPVLSYQVPDTFMTAGMLTGAGEQVEMIEMPTAFTPLGGGLQVEVSPSLAADLISGMDALEAFPWDFTEPVVSRLLPNLELYRATQELGLSQPGLEEELQSEIDESLERLLRWQNEDGGWGWMPGKDSDDYITSYVVFALGRAREAGMYIPQDQVQGAELYLYTNLLSPKAVAKSWQLDRLVFQYYALGQLQGNQLPLNDMYEQRENLNPWSQALLALMLYQANVADQRAYDLLSNLESTALRSASGAQWEDEVNTSAYNFSSAHFNTAVVVYAVAQIDPASPLLDDGMRYLVTQRVASGGWASSYETAWVLIGLVEAMRATSDFNPQYAYEAGLNDETLLSGGIEGEARLTAINTDVPLGDLLADGLNELTISRGEGSGNLYYRALLNLARPAEEVQAQNKGLSISRSYHGVGAACIPGDCPQIESLVLGTESGTAEVRVTLTLPEEMSYLVLEDFIPAGAEIIDPRLKTSQADEIVYDPRDPFGDGWGWWYFNEAQIYDDHVRWIGRRVPAGTYVLSYYLQGVQPGEYRVLPAQAYEYYFPDVRGNTTGGVFVIE